MNWSPTLTGVNSAGEQFFKKICVAMKLSVVAFRCVSEGKSQPHDNFLPLLMTDAFCLRLARTQTFCF